MHFLVDLAWDAPKGFNKHIEHESHESSPPTPSFAEVVPRLQIWWMIALFLALVTSLGQGNGSPSRMQRFGGPMGSRLLAVQSETSLVFYGRFMRKELGNTCVEVRVAKSRWRPPAQPRLGLGGLDFSIFRRVEVIFRRLFQERRSRRPYIGRYNVNHSQVSHKILLWTKLFI